MTQTQRPSPSDRTAPVADHDAWLQPARPPPTSATKALKAERLRIRDLLTRLWNQPNFHVVRQGWQAEVAVPDLRTAWRIARRVASTHVALTPEGTDERGQRTEDDPPADWLDARLVAEMHSALRVVCGQAGVRQPTDWQLIYAALGALWWTDSPGELLEVAESLVIGSASVDSGGRIEYEPGSPAPLRHAYDPWVDSKQSLQTELVFKPEWPGGGKQPDDGRLWRDADAFIRALDKAVTDLRAHERKVTQEAVAKKLACNRDTLLKNLQRYEVDWRRVKRWEPAVGTFRWYVPTKRDVQQ